MNFSIVRLGRVFIVGLLASVSVGCHTGTGGSIAILGASGLVTVTAENMVRTELPKARGWLTKVRDAPGAKYSRTELSDFNTTIAEIDRIAALVGGDPETLSSPETVSSMESVLDTAYNLLRSLGVPEFAGTPAKGASWASTWWFISSP